MHLNNYSQDLFNDFNCRCPLEFTGKTCETANPGAIASPADVAMTTVTDATTGNTAMEPNSTGDTMMLEVEGTGEETNAKRRHGSQT